MKNKNNKENSLAKNTIALYIRMLFSVCINIYISRAVLDVLGVSDYGIFSVVAGIVSLLGFINSSMSGATSRFLSFAIGEGDKQKLLDTYNAAKHLHFAIAILIFFLAETFGLWIVNSYLKLPEGRMDVANLIYQFSIFTTIFSILQVPYSSVIISKERLDVYAEIEIAKVLLKLLAVLSLYLFLYDRLMIYGILLLLVSLTIFIIYALYCHFAYRELPFSRKVNIGIINPMLSFSGWDLLGWGGYSLNSQGRQIFINRFFGVAMNTANGIAATASGAIMAFTNNIVMAFRPRVMKQYAAENYNAMQKSMETALFVSILLMGLLVAPMYFGMGFLLDVWLVEVPEHALDFCRLLILFQFSEVINNVIKIGIHASGKMRNFTIMGFLIQLLNVVLTYLLFYFGYSAVSTYIIAFILSIGNVLVNLYFLKICIPNVYLLKISHNIILGSAIVCLGAVLCYGVSLYSDSNTFVGFVFLTIINSVVIFIVACIKYHAYLREIIIKKFKK